MYGDAGRWGHTKGGTAAEKRCATTGGWIAFLGVFRSHDMAGGIIPAVCGFSSDLDQNRAVLWSKSEHETLETPETPETPETLDVDVRIAFL